MIRLRGVTKAFRDAGREVPILRGVDLEVAAREMVAVVGPSGSGKSTLLYVAGALDQDFEGEAVVAGVPLAGLAAEARADLRNRSIGFVFQSFNLLQGLSALENVMLPGLLRHGDAADGELRARAERAHEHRADDARDGSSRRADGRAGHDRGRCRREDRGVAGCRHLPLDLVGARLFALREAGLVR
ncbi:MAG TPA: ATP-binding cassette domain-containing protein, partial [Anaeromyxobacter sp.]|nr:ATP-binding cassette domain-containing protein [Anaeromyxobacter sp.]